MGIVYEYSNTEDRIYPVLLCDRCGQRITAVNDAHVAWPDPAFDGPGPWRTGPPVFVHKACDDTRLNWDSLETFLAQLQYRLAEPTEVTR